MKQFLYLDHDVVNSIIAQAEKGIVLSASSEHETSVDTVQKAQTNVNANATLKGSFIKVIKGETSGGINKERSSEENLSSITRDIVTKSMHDAAFDVAYEYVSPIKCSQDDDSDCDYGKYIEVSRVFDFIDFDYIQNLFSDRGFISFLKESEKEKIQQQFEEELSTLNREQERTNKSRIQKLKKEEIDKIDRKYDDINKLIDVFRTLIPYTRMLISYDGFLIPLVDDYFRIDPRNLGFKYGGQMTCVGFITNLIGEETRPLDNTSPFASLQFTVNETLRSFLPTKEKTIYVIHPLAVYYG